MLYLKDNQCGQILEKEAQFCKKIAPKVHTAVFT